MDLNSKGKAAALLVADMAVLNGIVMGFLYLLSKQWGEAFVVVALAVVGGYYLAQKGWYWPSQYIHRYWRRYVF